MTTDGNTQEAWFALAARHELRLARLLREENIGLDFRVVLAEDETGRGWVLRQPRRATAAAKIAREKAVLDLLRPRLPAAMPDWRIVHDELVAYPLLPGEPALVFDAAKGEVLWRVDRESPILLDGFAKTLAALHAVSVADAAAAGVPVLRPDEVRQRLRERIDRVKRALGMHTERERRWRAWLDADDGWPDFSAMTHGDLYPGHVLVDADGRVTAVIDWTEAEVADPALDFSGQWMSLGERGFEELLRRYEAAGGRVWPGFRRQVAAWAALAPLQYACFALDTGEGEHLRQAREQLHSRE